VVIIVSIILLLSLLLLLLLVVVFKYCAITVAIQRGDGKLVQSET